MRATFATKAEHDAWREAVEVVELLITTTLADIEMARSTGFHAQVAIERRKLRGLRTAREALGEDR